MRYAERLKLRQEQERKVERFIRNSERRRKRLAGRTAYCYLCKKESTYGELRVYGTFRAHPKSDMNRCEPCFEKELAEEDYSPAFEERYPGEDIWWKTA
jgi:hypothetical protein